MIPPFWQTCCRMKSWCQRMWADHHCCQQMKTAPSEDSGRVMMSQKTCRQPQQDHGSLRQPWKLKARTSKTPSCHHCTKLMRIHREQQKVNPQLLQYHHGLHLGEAL